MKYAGARRVLFLVDRGNLGRQTLKEFQQFVSPVIKAALAPLATNPDLRNLLKKIAKAADQTIDIMILPDKPTSPNQKYRLTAKGRAWLATRKPKEEK